MGEDERRLDGAFRLVLASGALAAGLLVLSLVRGLTTAGSPGPSPASPAGGTSSAPVRSTSADVASYLVPTPWPAPPIQLTDADDRPFELARDRGNPTFVFFGYTHCPDVCPATVGAIGQAMEAFGRPARAVFVTVDPERDTTSWLREYRRFLAPGFETVTGSPAQIATTASGWGVRYARVETGTPGDYSMSHTADVWLVDGSGVVRARFPFGTTSAEMLATLRAVAADQSATSGPAQATLPTSANSAVPSPAALGVVVVSSSVWAGPASPVILDLSLAGARIDDPTVAPRVQVRDRAGAAAGDPVTAVAVQPPGETRVLYVATVAIPSTGWWTLDVAASRGNVTLHGTADVAALDPGTTAAIGEPAPTAHTPTLADVGGNARAVTTDPAPDLRLSQTSTTDALVAHQPFVLVIDSTKFKITSACGKALVMARYLVDRWPGVAFIHLEPLRYDVITDTPVLEGSLAAPTLTDPAAAWGLAGDPLGPRAMPWVFVVDGRGVVRAKAEGVMGSDDVDVIVAMILAGG